MTTGADSALSARCIGDPRGRSSSSCLISSVFLRYSSRFLPCWLSLLIKESRPSICSSRPLRLRFSEICSERLSPSPTDMPPTCVTRFSHTASRSLPEMRTCVSASGRHPPSMSSSWKTASFDLPPCFSTRTILWSMSLNSIERLRGSHSGFRRSTSMKNILLTRSPSGTLYVDGEISLAMTILCTSSSNLARPSPRRSNLA